MKEYIGITGFKTEDEIELAKYGFEDSGIYPKSEMTGMLGFLVFDSQAQNSYAENNRGPSLRKLNKLLDRVPHWLMPAIHYCSKSRQLDPENVFRILEFQDIYGRCKAVQLNLDWPRAENLKQIKKRFPDIYLIQQVNPRLLPVITTVKKAQAYEGIVDKFLIDPSLGAGLEYDVRETSQLINALKEKLPSASFVACGGLDEENVHYKVTATLKEVKTGFSIDAEGRLREKYGLNSPKMLGYIANAAIAFKESKSI